MLTKDERRAFSEAQRISIYRRDNGLCQQCLAEGKPEKEAQVPWSEYEADHVIPHSKGGQTIEENAQVLCRFHNQQKSNRMTQ
jgi:5-methylcytosine-specific restriction endonuclease McrA